MNSKPLMATWAAMLLAGCSVTQPPKESEADPKVAPASAEEDAGLRCAQEVKALPAQPATQAPPPVDLVFWCTKAAQRGDRQAQWILAGLYERGLGVPPSQSEAFRWTQAAAGQGLAEAQFHLGQMYGRGEGVALDRRTATLWYRKAADQGHLQALYYMGYRAQHGKGMPQSLTEAVGWYQKAAEGGQAEAMAGLGTLSQQGQGVPQNLVEAYKWFNLAAVSGHKPFQTLRDRVAQRLSAGQLAEGQRLASEWVQRHPGVVIATP